MARVIHYQQGDNDFEIEVGSPVYERLVGQGLLGKVSEAESEALAELNVGELREQAEGLGIDTHGLKKAELIDRIEAERA